MVEKTKVNSGHKGQHWSTGVKPTLQVQRGPHSQREQWYGDGQRKSMDVSGSQRKSTRATGA